MTSEDKDAKEITKSATDGFQLGVTSDALTPSFVCVSLNIFAYAVVCLDREGIQKLFASYEAHTGLFVTGYVIASFGVASLLQLFNHQLFRIFEGRWHSAFDFAADWLKKRQRNQKDILEKELKALDADFKLTRTNVENQISSRFEQEQKKQKLLKKIYELGRSYSETDLLPTQLGNRMAAAENYAFERYGIDSVLLWSRLSAVLPEGFASTLSKNRGHVDVGLNFCCLFILSSVGWLVFVTLTSISNHGGFLLVLELMYLWLTLRFANLITSPQTIFGFIALACIPMTICYLVDPVRVLHGPGYIPEILFLVLAWASYKAACNSAQGYCSSIEIAYDLYRSDLLKAFGHKIDAVNSKEERELWLEIGKSIIYKPSLDEDDDEEVVEKSS